MSALSLSVFQKRMAIPIFVISFNRLRCLSLAIESYRQAFGDQIEIVVCDNGSDFPPLIDFLNNPPEFVSKVYFNRKIEGINDMVSLVRGNIEDHFSETGRQDYVVTDPDIVLEKVDSRMLDFYKHLLGTTGVAVVGPMLRIDDIPDKYPKRKFVIEKHYDFFWSKVPGTVEYEGVEYHVLSTRIDTTFAMHRGTEVFDRLKAGYRTYAPFMARHLDWYVDWNNAPEDMGHYGKTAVSGVSHFSVPQSRLSVFLDNIRYKKQKIARYFKHTLGR